MNLSLRNQIAYWRTFTVPEAAHRLKDGIYRTVAWYLLPKRLREWVIIRAMADATTGKYSHVEAPAVLAVDVLKRMK